MHRAGAIFFGLAVTAIVACTSGSDTVPYTSSSGGSSSSGSSSSGSSVPVPRVVAVGRLNSIDGEMAVCNSGGAVVGIGSFGRPNVPAAHGEYGVTVACSVTGSMVDGVGESANVDGAYAVRGAMGPSGARGVAVRVRSWGKEFRSDDCEVTYPEGGGVAAGRFWGKITCDRLEVDDPNDLCSLEAEVLFENCTQ